MTAIAEIARGHDLPGLPDRPITVAEYHGLIDEGSIGPGDKVELLEGWVTAKMGHGDDHVTAVQLVPDAIRSLLPVGWRVLTQLPIVTDSHGEPEPDVCVARGPVRGRPKPPAADTALVVEIAESSLYEDRNRKRRMYAASGIAIYWIVNLNSHRIEVYTEPTIGADGEPTYAVRSDFAAGEDVPLMIEGREVGRIPVNELLP